MKPTKQLLVYACLFLMTAGVFLSCKKDEKDENVDQNAISLTVANTTADALYDDVFDVVLQDGQAANVAGKGQTCATVTLDNNDPNTFPKVMTIDFGAGCTSVNGITRKGKLTVTLTGKIRTNGTVITVAFDNYFVNNYKLEGTFSVTNNSTQNGLGFTTQTVNGKLTYPDGSTYYTHSGSHTVTQTAGAGTPSFADDSFSITGSGSTSSSAGNSLTTNITTPLVKNALCKNVVSGVRQFVYNNISGSLDYGDGTCDNLAVLNVASRSYPVTLPR